VAAAAGRTRRGTVMAVSLHRWTPLSSVRALRTTSVPERFSLHRRRCVNAGNSGQLNYAMPLSMRAKTTDSNVWLADLESSIMCMSRVCICTLFMYCVRCRTSRSHNVCLCTGAIVSINFFKKIHTVWQKPRDVTKFEIVTLWHLEMSQNVTKCHTFSNLWYKGTFTFTFTFYVLIRLGTALSKRSKQQ